MIQGHLFGTGPHFLWRLGQQYGSHLKEEKSGLCLYNVKELNLCVYKS